MPTSRGVYFLANDPVLDLAIAFLNSFRRSNPGVPLCLIPFDDRIEAIAQLQERYNFCLWASPDLLRRCDEISKTFHGRVFGHYRKLAMWDGGYDEFVYIDTDTVVLESLEAVFSLVREFAFLTSTSDLSYTLKWVWKKSIFDVTSLSERQIRFAANTGFIASRKGALTLDEITARIPAAADLLPHMELFCIEQSLLNYLIVTSGKRYTSLYTLMRTRRRGDLPQEAWGGDAIGTVRQGRIVYPSYPRVLLVHWAGQAHKAVEGTMPNQELWSFYRHLGPEPRSRTDAHPSRPGAESSGN